ncbi:hypothetical protein EHJ03_21685 [Cronobacter dublinensis]|nr:hypothetical protein [Cronobacter dublinensis]
MYKSPGFDHYRRALAKFQCFFAEIRLTLLKKSASVTGQHCSENVCVALAKFRHRNGLWITLCANAYKPGFCWGMQQSDIFMSFSCCGEKRTPYNAPPSTRR